MFQVGHVFQDSLHLGWTQNRGQSLLFFWPGEMIIRFLPAKHLLVGEVGFFLQLCSCRVVSGARVFSFVWRDGRDGCPPVLYVLNGCHIGPGDNKP